MKIATAFFIGLFCGSLAHAFGPSFTAASPSGGQRGTEVEIVLRGERLEDAEEILFYSPGIEVVMLELPKANAVRAKIRIAADCRIGEHALRIRTATGISELRTFWVGPFPTVDEIEPNNEWAKAQKIPSNVTVSGVLNAEDVDCFQVPGKKGQRLSVEIEGIRMGRAMIDPYVSIQDSKGKVIASVDDTALLAQDPFISLIAPEDGDYTILVRESAYGGNANAAYRMHVGNFPRPAAVYPAGGKTGEALTVDFIGDATGEFTQRLELPAHAQEKFGALAQQNGATAPSPNWMRVSPFPNVLESEPNNEQKQATVCDEPLPLAFNGIIGQKGDVDWFRFKARKGQALDVTVYALRIGSPLDSVIEILDAKGTRLGQNDDSVGSDSYVRFTPGADGDYFLKITDQLGRGGADFTYRVEITEPKPTVTLYIPDFARNDTQTRKAIAVPKGNRFAVLINAKRSNFNDPLNLSIDGLPDGVTLRSDTMPGKLSSIPVVFEADADAKIGGKLLGVTARPADPAKDPMGSFLQDVELVYGQPNNTTYYQTSVDKLAVAVVDEVPYKINIVEPKVPLVQNGSLDLRVEAERKPGFDEPITVKMLFNPPGVGSQPDVTIPKGSNSVIYRLNANANADLRSWKIAVAASAKVQGATVWVSSQLAKLDIAPPFLQGKIDLTTTERGKPARVVCKLDQKIPFEGKAMVKLMGLPASASAPDREITKDDKDVVFDLTTDEKTPVGQNKALFCSVTFIQNSEPIVQSIANGGILRIDAPKGKPSETVSVSTPKKVSAANVKK